MSKLDEEKEIEKISNEIIDEILREEQWLKKMKGCFRGSIYSRNNKEWIDNHMGSIHSAIAHDDARFEHFRRVRGYNG